MSGRPTKKPVGKDERIEALTFLLNEALDERDRARDERNRAVEDYYRVSDNLNDILSHIQWLVDQEAETPDE